MNEKKLVISLVLIWGVAIIAQVAMHYGYVPSVVLTTQVVIQFLTLYWQMEGTIK